MNDDQSNEHPIPHDLDRTLHTQLARLTQGISPASIVGAYLDWLTHLAMSPGKQQELAARAARKSLHFGLYAAKAAFKQGSKPCIEPLPQDRRFAAPEWQQWPFNLIYQAFLLNQQWWHKATTGVSGVTAHHEHVATFSTRQLLDIFSPSNFLLTNPEVLAETMKTGGMNLLQGAQKQWQDALRFANGKPLPGTEDFRPGKEVALTPGNSLVRYLVEKGHTVFIMSWKNPDSGDSHLGMDDYLKAGVMAALDAVTSIIPGQRIQALGYCLGGTLLSIAAAFMARSHDKRLKSLALLASEIDFKEPGELGLFIDESQLAFLDSVMASKGYLDGKQMAGAFALLNSRDLVWSRMEHNYLMGRTRPVSDLAAWNLDATRMPYRQHSEYLRKLYLRNDLAEGRYRVNGRPVALSDIRVPIFALGTQRDTVSPWHAAYKITLLTHAEVTFCLCSGGHNVGVVNPPGAGVKRSYQLATREAGAYYMDPDTWLATAPEYEGSWWPALDDWLQRQTSQRVVPPAMGNQANGYPALEDAPSRYVLVP